MNKETETKEEKKEEAKVEQKQDSLRIVDRILEHNLAKLVEKLEKKTSKKLPENKDRRKTPKPEHKDEKKHEKSQTYSPGALSAAEYHRLEASNFYKSYSPDTYRSNIRTNSDMYSADSESVAKAVINSANLSALSSEQMDDLRQKFMFNFIAGAAIDTVHPDRVEQMKNILYDPAEKAAYFVKMSLMGFGYQNLAMGGFSTTLKTMHTNN